MERARVSRRARATAVALAALSLSVNAAALDASDGYVHRRFESRDGLPQNLVRALAQTPDGYLWVATDEGIARFDGARFAVLDRRTLPGMPSALVTALLPDGAGGLWVGTDDQGVFRLRDGEVVSPLGPADGLRRVQAMARGGGDDVWVGTERGLFQLRGGAVARRWGTADGLPGDEVWALHVDRSGAVWVGTERGAARIRGGAVEPGPAELRGVAVRALSADAAGDVWFAAHGRGVAWLHDGRVRFLGARDGLPSARADAILCDRGGNVWVGTLAGLARVRDGRVVSLGRTVPDRVQALLEDAEGALWIGTETALERLRVGDFRTYGPPEGVPGRDANVVAELPDGTVWIGTDAGLSRSVGERFEPVLVGGRAVGLVLALHVDGRGHLWVSTRGDERTWLSEWDGTRLVRSWPAASDRPDVFAIASAADGTLLLGTGRGLLRLRGEAFEDVPGTRARVNAVAIDARGVAWAATDLEWVFTLDGDRLVPAPWPGAPPQRTATGLRPEPDGTLWVTTEGSGLWRLRDGRWTSVDRQDGMMDDVIWAMLDDGRGQLWFSSNRGVWRVDRRELEARLAGARAEPVTSWAYGEADGMRSRECNGGSAPAGLRSRDGRLWFPTTDGVAVVDPARLTPRPPLPRALLEGARVDGRPVKGPLALPPGAARLELAFTGVTLVDPDRVRFRYRLAGFDRDWVDAGTARSATYTNLSPGSYRFEVEAGTVTEGWGPAASIAVRQRPRFYQTLWFYALVGGLAALLGFAAHVLRTWRLRVHERVLEERVREALADVRTLSGLIPICAWCKKIRDDDGYWQRLESYLAARSEARFSHGMCPECYERTDPGEHELPEPPAKKCGSP